ncbi:MAG: hypothetical protein IT373_38015, partial [Polyangiaceae bacterium]|nr:hypothetical protein [Polyangiaceae bacterium]
MNETLLPSIVRIEVPGSRGTGFVVRFERRAPGLAVVEVVTALHVVAHMNDSRARQSTVWRDGSATVRLQSGEELGFRLNGAARSGFPDDWALLHFEGGVET